MASIYDNGVLSWLLIAAVLLSLALSVTTLVLQVRRGRPPKNLPITRPRADQQIRPPFNPQGGVQYQYPNYPPKAPEPWRPPAQPVRNDIGHQTESLFPSGPMPYAMANEATEHMRINEYRLRIKEATPNREQDYEITVRGELTVGRSSSCGLQIDDPTVSGLQCVLISGPDSLYISNKSNSNITRLNGMKLAETRPLKPGDTLQFGKVRLTLMDIRINR